MLSAQAQQKTRHLSLDNAIEIAMEKSPTAMAAAHSFRSSYWSYRTFEAEYLPQLSLDATLPNYSNTITAIQQDDGGYSFQSYESAQSSATLSLSQKIGMTGGEVFLQSGMQRLDLYAYDSATYMTTPINIGFSQPIFGFNAYKWNKKIKPLEYKEAKQTYIETLEQVKLETASYFFNVLMAQMTHKINLINQANSDTLYKIAKGRYNIGTIAENELLQLELRLLNANASVEQSRLDLEDKLFELKSFLRLPEDHELRLMAPQPHQVVKVDLDKALVMAKANRSDALAFERQTMEAEMDVYEAKRSGRFSMTLYAEYGLAQSAAEITDAYTNPGENQMLRVGINVPIIDWGLAKGNIRMAESNRELIRSNVEQERIDFEQEVMYQVAQFNMQDYQLQIAAKSDTIAQKRYHVTKQRYLIGRISVTELNIAQEERDNAQLGYIQALYNYWTSYYTLRKKTLFDFEKDQEIAVDPEQLLEK